jgi:polysaccharide biosynthesis/export protein
MMLLILLKRVRRLSFAAIFILAGITGCAHRNADMTQGSSPFDAYPSSDTSFTDQDVLDLYEASLSKEYYIGPGDRLKIEVWRRPELSGEHIVGPYGEITLNFLGQFKIGGKTVKEAVDSIKSLYEKYYDAPVVTVSISEYMNNKVYVLGGVSRPGMMRLDGNGTLLEAISIAGGISTHDKNATPPKCYIVRGKDQIIWIDLNQLLEKANIGLNISLANNDIIYVLESIDASVFVMGEAKSPGAYSIKRSGLTLLEAINLAGGATEDADIAGIRLVRGIKDREGARIIDLNRMMTQGDFSKNYSLRDKDIIYIPRKGIAKFNYYLRQINPFVSTFLTGKLISEAFND